MDKLSIIIPVYNAERHISKCIHSIIDGHSLDDVEIICIDDGSKDMGGEICESFSDKYEKIHVIHQSNQGVASARNAGVNVAKGEYIAWVDSDDYVEKTWLPDILSVIKNNYPEMVLIDYYKEDKFEKRIISLPFREKAVKKSDVIYELSRDMILHSCLWQYVIHRSFFDGYHFDIKDIVQEDYKCLTQLLPKIHTIYYLKCPLYNYVQNENSLLHAGTNIKKSFDSIVNAKERYEYFTQLGYKASRVGYYRALIGNGGYLIYTDQKAWQTKQVYQYLKKELFNMMRSKELDKFMKLKAITLLLPSKLFKYLYRNRHNLA
ncbi:glycosyltransferase family 2 protein [Mitsuokella multacida]|jgi:glycosyltransferase involved in cell wall biosynthesis|uniref:glycosyltransferase family 2 protein n=1 Tax=Mitsuokella multacida TaxID=52226 RepID=UPI0022E3437C|nr:glycosyltransferase family 2 protein [Mitsuokella multacida]